MLRTRNDLIQHIRIHNKIGVVDMNPVQVVFPAAIAGMVVSEGGIGRDTQF